jgi:hypothetical protein
MASPTKRQIATFPTTAQAPALHTVRKAVEDARTQTPHQRGWICHTSLHYNTPGSVASPLTPCSCSHSACRSSPPDLMTVHQRGEVYNFPCPPTCFDVVLTTRDHPSFTGWVCFFCKMYTVCAIPDNGIAAPTCGSCGAVEENEVVFVRRLATAENEDEEKEEDSEGFGGAEEYGEDVDDQAEEWVSVLKRRGWGGKSTKRAGDWSRYETVMRPAW